MVLLLKPPMWVDAQQSEYFRTTCSLWGTRVMSVMCDLCGSLHSHALGVQENVCVFSCNTPKWLNALCQSSLSGPQRFTRQLMPWRNGLPSSILIPTAFLSSLPSFLPVRANLMWHIFTRTQALVIVRALVDPCNAGVPKLVVSAGKSYLMAAELRWKRNTISQLNDVLNRPNPGVLFVSPLCSRRSHLGSHPWSIFS